jgi:predicted deacylase
VGLERTRLGGAPAFVVRGDRDGPHVLLLAGLEEWEHSATAGLLRAVRELDPATLAGTVTAVPQAAGAGSLPAADAVVELRTAPPWQAAAPHARGGAGGVAASLGLPWLEAAGNDAAVAGSGGRLEPAAVRALAAAARAALAPTAARPPLEPVAVDGAAAGWWVAAVRPGEEVHEGSLLGRIRDPWGDVVADVRSPSDGVVLVLTIRPPVGTGDRLVLLARPTL